MMEKFVVRRLKTYGDEVGTWVAWPISETETITADDIVDLGETPENVSASILALLTDIEAEDATP